MAARNRNVSAGNQREHQVPGIAVQGVGKRPHPSAQPQGHCDRGNRDHGRVFRQEKERPAEAAVFGVKAGGQFGFGFRQIERRAIGFRHHGDRKNKERDQPQREELEGKPDMLGLLRLHDSDHAQGADAFFIKAGHQDRGNYRQAHRDFVGNHLRAGAQRAHQRVVGVGRPSRHDHAEHAQRRNAQHEQHADIHVGDGVRGAEGHNNKDGECGDHDDQRRDPEDERVGLGRHDVFLDQKLERVGDGLQQAVGADSHGAQANLHVRQNFPLQPVHGDHGHRESAERSGRYRRTPRTYCRLNPAWCRS